MSSSNGETRCSGVTVDQAGRQADRKAPFRGGGGKVHPNVEEDVVDPARRVVDGKRSKEE